MLTKQEKAAYQKQWRAKNKDKIRASAREYWHTNKDRMKAEYRCHQRDYARIHEREYHLRRPEVRLVSQAKNRAKSRGLDFNITTADIRVPKVCPVLGIPLVVLSGKGCATDNSATIDRIDNTKGYIQGNVRIISWRANRIKNDATFEEIKLIFEDMKKRNEAK